MARRMRAFTSLVLVLLIALEVTPPLPSASAVSHPKRCEIAASVDRVTFVAVPSGGSSAATEPATMARTPVMPFMVDATTTWMTAHVVAATTNRDAIDDAEHAWVRLHRRCARAPDNPDPL